MQPEHDAQHFDLNTEQQLFVDMSDTIKFLRAGYAMLANQSVDNTTAEVRNFARERLRGAGLIMVAPC